MKATELALISTFHPKKATEIKSENNRSNSSSRSLSYPMWVATVLPKPAPPVLSVLTSSRNPKQNSFHFRFSYRPLNFKVSATKQQQQLPEPEKKNPSSSDIGWLPAFPHVLIASMSNFVFGYHIGFVSLSHHILQYLCSNYPDDGT